jgi:hypothetical protein
VGEVTAQVTIATIAVTPKNTVPTTFRSISGFALPSVIHRTNLSYRLPVFETSTSALCGTAGNDFNHTSCIKNTNSKIKVIIYSRFKNG